MRRVSALADDLALALELAGIADAITHERYRADDLAVSTKEDLTPVTEADTAAEQAMRERLAEARPRDAVVGEEYGSQGDGASRRWIVDPIDGTKSYVRGIPAWATLLALQEDGEGVLGIVSAPALGRRWWAARGEGAFASDTLTGATRRMHVSAVAELSTAQLSFAGLEDWEPGERLDALLALVHQSARTRSFGDFWAYMLVAEGALDIAIDPVVSLWDLAAPQVIVEAAGGRFSDLRGHRSAEGGDAIATNGHLHDAALAIVGRR
jgi:histidinol-phosphatase